MRTGFAWPRPATFLVVSVALVATVALAGRAWHAKSLQAWSPNTVSMKETTAWLLIEHCWAGFIISRPLRRGECLPVYFIAGLTLLMACGLTVEILRSPSELASFDPQNSFFPSVMTVAAACLLALKAFAATLLRAPRLARAFSCAVAAIGASALVGYVAGCPAMYFFIPGCTTAMAINTAVCFLLLGLVSVSTGET